MKKDLLDLIEQINDMKSRFHTSGGFGMPLIYDREEFSTWKQQIQFELQGIYDRTQDKFIFSTLENLKQGFDGWNDEQSFNELCGGLHTIKKNVDKYYSTESETPLIITEASNMAQKKHKVFISHSSKDKTLVESLVNLLEDIGLSEEEIFCSSIPGYGIELGEDIYDYLKRQFHAYELHVFFILSNNYYKSTACMNEMGAAWVLQNRYTTILLPGFEFKEIEGAINPRQIGLKLGSDIAEIREKLGQLKNALIQEFGLEKINNIRWERKREAFIDEINKFVKPNKTISDGALQILQAACDAANGTIIKSEDFSGQYIQVNEKQFITSQERREVAKWEACLDELLNCGFVEEKGKKGMIFVVTMNGYDYIEHYNS